MISAPPSLRPHRYRAGWQRRNRIVLIVLVAAAAGVPLRALASTRQWFAIAPPVDPQRVSAFCERIDVNTASVASLQRLARIGPTRAKTIVAYRSANGPFASLDALTYVPGIGPATVARLRPWAVAHGPQSQPVSPEGH